MTKIRMGAFILPSAGAAPNEIRKGFAGQNPIYYQRGLRDTGRLVRQLEDLGFDFVAFSEHHFHVEGLELSNNPVLLGTWAAMLTKKIRVGQMGNVLPARNPLLLAEDLAMLDHFSEGRMMAGFARGYQARHVATVGQKLNAFATDPMDPEFAEHDRINRELFLEHYDIIRKAWREPLFSHDGKHWKIPPTGIKWDHPATIAMAPGMVGADGRLEKVGVAPATLQDPSAIEIYMPFVVSPASVEWAARESVIPLIFTPVEQVAKACVDLYHEKATAAGRKLNWGQGMGHFREIIVADTQAEADAIQDSALGFIWTTWHDWFGLNEALRNPGETGPIPNTPANIRDRQFSLCGTVDTVARQLEKMIKTYSVEMIVPWIASGVAPIDGLLKSNELLVEKVLPKIGVELEQFKPTLRNTFSGPTYRQN